jgi:hypothetical protein
VLGRDFEILCVYEVDALYPIRLLNDCSLQGAGDTDLAGSDLEAVGAIQVGSRSISDRNDLCSSSSPPGGDPSGMAKTVFVVLVDINRILDLEFGAENGKE